MTNREKYNQVFTSVFEIGEEKLNEELVYTSIPAWDSIGHMAMIAELEDVFDIMMDTEDVIEFSSFYKGMELLKKYEIEI
jgi:acyl carrier protein